MRLISPLERGTNRNLKIINIVLRKLGRVLIFRNDSNNLKLCEFLGVGSRAVEVFVLMGCDATSLGCGRKTETLDGNHFSRRS